MITPRESPRDVGCPQPETDSVISPRGDYFSPPFSIMVSTFFRCAMTNRQCPLSERFHLGVFCVSLRPVGTRLHPSCGLDHLSS